MEDQIKCRMEDRIKFQMEGRNGVWNEFHIFIHTRYGVGIDSGTPSCSLLWTCDLASGY
jgi:hypothetical protein